MVGFFVAMRKKSNKLNGGRTDTSSNRATITKAAFTIKTSKATYSAL